jgi:hypothetical protein
MWPSFNISPDFADTKLIGLRGISILARACLASSSMIKKLNIAFVEGESGGDARQPIVRDFTVIVSDEARKSNVIEK